MAGQQFMNILDVKEAEWKTKRWIFKCLSPNSPEAYVVLHTQVNFKGKEEINSAIAINLILLQKKYVIIQNVILNMEPFCLIL